MIELRVSGEVAALPTVVGSFLAALPASARDRLLADATTLEMPAGAVIFSSTDPLQRVGVVLAGLARVFLTAPNGRQVTTRYAGVGSLVGNTAGRDATRAPLSIGAVTDCAVVELPLETLRALGEADGRVAWAFLEEISLRLQDSYAALAANCFGSMAERLGRHLLDLAAEDQDEQRLVATVTQQALADGVGTVREVVARALRRLRAAGLVETQPGRVIILDPKRLAALVGRWR